MTTVPSNPATPARLRLTAWRDQRTEAAGHRPGSAYVENVYLGVLGPSATWLWQRCARLAAHQPLISVDMADLAVSLGLGESLGPNAAITRTLGRLVRFDTARRDGDTLAVRLALPDLSLHRCQRLSASARMAHQHLAVANRTAVTCSPDHAASQAVSL